MAKRTGDRRIGKLVCGDAEWSNGIVVGVRGSESHVGGEGRNVLGGWRNKFLWEDHGGKCGETGKVGEMTKVARVAKGEESGERTIHFASPGCKEG